MRVRSEHNWQQNSERQRLLYGLILILFLAVGSAQAWGDETYSMEPIRPGASAHFSQSLVDTLRPQGFRVSGDSDGVKTAICEIFFARAIATQDGALGSGVLYGRVKPGTLVGVIHFLIVERYVRDYRSQTLRPGYYTMRYAAMPEGANGSDLDFVLLSPLSSDRNPAQVLPLNELVRRGRLASRTKRPAMMSLVEVDPDQNFPSLITDDEGTSVLQLKLRVKSAKARKGDPLPELPLALVVVTFIPEDLGD